MSVWGETAAGRSIVGVVRGEGTELWGDVRTGRAIVAVQVDAKRTYLWVNTTGASAEFATRVGLVMTFVGFGLALLFLRIVDTKARMPISYLGAAWYVLSTLIPALVGENVTTLLLWPALGAIGCAFAFEAILKVWTQESFPPWSAGPLRARSSASLACWPLCWRWSARGWPPRTAGSVHRPDRHRHRMAAAIFAFHKASRNEFDIEAESSRKAAMPTRTHCTESVRELQRWHPPWRQASRIRIRPLSFAVLGTDVDEAGRCGWCRRRAQRCRHRYRR